MMNQLIKLGLISEENLYVYANKTRDKDHCIVLRDAVTGVIFIKDGAKELDEIILEPLVEGLTTLDLLNSRAKTVEDNSRRLAMIMQHSFDSLLDFGCGSGLLISDLKHRGKQVFGVEIKSQLLKLLSSSGLYVSNDIKNLHKNDFDMITMFHVLEHLEDPVSILNNIRDNLSNHGKLIIEIPNANDALLSLYKNDCFKEHTLWSEHRVLYTKQALMQLLSFVGFSDIQVVGIQRYGLGNHINWIKDCKSNGDNAYELFNNDKFFLNYEKQLDRFDMTDTLLCVCRK